MRKGLAGLMVILFFVVTGCSDKDSVPYGILSVNKMSTVMWDMIQADQYAGLLGRDSAHVNARTEHLRLYDQIFRLHDVSREKFQKSYKYYLEHPELNQILYDSVIAHGNRLRSEAYAHPASRPAVTPGTPAVTTPAIPQKPLIPGRPINPPIPGKPALGKPTTTKSDRGTLRTDTTFKNRIPHNRLPHTQPTGTSSNPAGLRTSR